MREEMITRRVFKVEGLLWENVSRVGRRRWTKISSKSETANTVYQIQKLPSDFRNVEHSSHLSFRSRNEFIRLVDFIPHQQLTSIFRGISVHLHEPVIYVIERLLRSDIVHHNNPVGAAVICTGDCSKPFLACCVPYLQLHNAFIEFHSAKPEIHANGRYMILCKCVVGEAQQNARFAHTGVPNYHQLRTKKK